VGFDRLGRENTMILTFLLQAACLSLVVTLGQLSGAWFAATLVAVYFTWGQIYSLFPSTAGDYFGTRHATSNYAVLYTAKGVAAVIGPWFGALLFERSQSWALGFYGSALMALVAAAIAFGSAPLGVGQLNRPCARQRRASALATPGGGGGVGGRGSRWM
jgi:OFA family oxalate/formate antiporter-like MFS transporter